VHAHVGHRFQHKALERRKGLCHRDCSLIDLFLLEKSFLFLLLPLFVLVVLVQPLLNRFEGLGPPELAGDGPFLIVVILILLLLLRGSLRGALIVCLLLVVPRSLAVVVRIDNCSSLRVVVSCHIRALVCILTHLTSVLHGWLQFPGSVKGNEGAWLLLGWHLRWTLRVILLLLLLGNINLNVEWLNVLLVFNFKFLADCFEFNWLL